MPQHKIAYIALAEPDTTLAEQGLAGLDYEMNAHFCSSDGETIEAIKGVEVIIDAGVPMPRHIIEQIDTAKAIVSLGHGFDRVDHNAATDKGVMVVNCAGFCTDEVADHSIMLLLACAKNLTRFHDIVRSGGVGQERPLESPADAAHRRPGSRPDRSRQYRQGHGPGERTPSG